MGRHRVIVVNRPAVGQTRGGSTLDPHAARAPGPRRVREPSASASASAVGRDARARARRWARAPAPDAAGDVEPAQHVDRREHCRVVTRDLRAARRTAGSRARAAGPTRRRRRSSGSPLHERADDLVIGQAGLHERAGSRRGPAREQLGAARRAARAPARPRGTAAPAAPGRGRGTRPARAAGGASSGTVQHRLGADHDVGRRRLLRSRRRRRRTRQSRERAPRNSSRTRVTPARERRRRRVAPHSSQIIGRSARLGPSAGGAWHASHARHPEAGPRRLSTHTAGPRRVAQRVGQRLGEQPGTGRLLAPVDDERRAANPALRHRAASASSSTAASPSASTVGAGETTAHDAPARARPLVAARRARARWATAPPAALRRRRRRRSRPRDRARAPARPARPPTTTHAAPRRSPPRRGPGRVGFVGVHRTRPRGPWRRRYWASDRARDPSADRDQRGALAARTSTRRARRRSASGGRRTRRNPPNRRELSVSAGLLEPRRLAMRSGWGRRGSGATRNAGPRCGGRPSATAIQPARSTTPGGGPSDATASTSSNRSRVPGSHVVGDDPAAHAAPVQRDAHDRADPDQRRERVRDRRSRRRARPP